MVVGGAVAVLAANYDMDGVVLATLAAMAVGGIWL